MKTKEKNKIEYKGFTYKGIFFDTQKIMLLDYYINLLKTEIRISKALLIFTIILTIALFINAIAIITH